MNFEIVFYDVCFTISIAIFLAIAKPGNFHSVQQGFAVIAIVFSNAGYLALSLSKNLREAILANKITYVGGVFLPLLFFMLICEMCSINLNRLISHFLYLIHLGFILLVLTIGYSDIYYKSVGYEVVNGAGRLIKSYGWGYSLFLMMLGAYLVATIAVVHHSLKHINTISLRSLISVLIGYVVAVFAFIGERLVGLEFDIVPLLYDVVCIATIFPVRNSNIYTVEDKMEKITGQKSLEAFITFDNKLRYMNSNFMAQTIFPELKEYQRFARIPADGNNFSEIVSGFVSENVDKLDDIVISKNVDVNEMTYEMNVSRIIDAGKRKVGYAVRLADISDRIKNIKMVEEYSQKLERDVQLKTRQIRRIQQKTIMGIAEMVESRDLSTGGHIKRTSEVIRIFNRKLLESDLELGEDFLNYVARSAPMHDLGKITVDDAVLRKRGKYTPEEYAEMKMHAEAGAEIVKRILTGIEEPKFVKVAENIAHYHHEKVDGTGYPEGLKGDEIPIEARIMALADVYDALVSKRCYKDAFSHEQAIAIIENDAGTHFDERLAKLFVECRTELEKYYDYIEDNE